MKSDALNFKLPRAFALLVAAAALSSTAAVADTGAGVWTKDTRGWARHVQSGIVCPSNLASGALALDTVIVGSMRQPPGEQVGCEYEGGGGSWSSVEVTRLGPNESVAAHSAALRQKLQTKFPGLLREGGQNNWRPKSPTGGNTFSAAYYNANVGDRRGVVAIAGGEVGGWMLSVVHFGFNKDSVDAQLAAITNWQAIATTRP